MCVQRASFDVHLVVPQHRSLLIYLGRPSCSCRLDLLEVKFVSVVLGRLLCNLQTIVLHNQPFRSYEDSAIAGSPRLTGFATLEAQPCGCLGAAHGPACKVRVRWHIACANMAVAHAMRFCSPLSGRT